MLPSVAYHFRTLVFGIRSSVCINFNVRLVLLCISFLKFFVNVCEYTRIFKCVIVLTNDLYCRRADEIIFWMWLCLCVLAHLFLWGGWGKSSPIPLPCVDCSWLLLRWLAVLTPLPPRCSPGFRPGLPWMAVGHWVEKSVAVCSLFICATLRDGTCSRPSSTLWEGLWLGSVSFRQKGFWPLGREMQTPRLHWLGRALWSIPQRVVRRGVGPAVALPSQCCTVGAGTRYLCCATRAGPLSRRWAKPLIRPFVKCSVVLCWSKCSPVGSGGPGAVGG